MQLKTNQGKGGSISRSIENISVGVNPVYKVIILKIKTEKKLEKFKWNVN